MHHLDVVARYTWRPDDVPTDATSGDDFLRLACLTYTDDDGPDRWPSAAALLDAEPNLPRVDVHAAAACADAGALTRLLTADATEALFAKAGRSGGSP